jgi:hypothetical protein
MKIAWDITSRKVENKEFMGDKLHGLSTKIEEEEEVLKEESKQENEEEVEP